MTEPHTAMMAHPDEVWFDRSDTGEHCCLCVAFDLWTDANPADPNNPQGLLLAGMRRIHVEIGGTRDAVATIPMEQVGTFKGRLIFRSTEWHPVLDPAQDAIARVSLLSFHRQAGR